MNKSSGLPPQITFDVQGHRGCRGLMPENTIPAMIKSIQLGVTTLEMDVVITADKKVILSHEPFMSWEIATSPEGKSITFKEEKNYNIYRMDFAAVSSWDVGSRPHLRFPRQEKMKVSKPLLEEVIDSVEAYVKKNHLSPVQYNIETKCQPSTDNIFHPEPAEFIDLLMEIISKKQLMARVIIQSFDVRTLKVMHEKFRNVSTALLVEGFSKQSLAENLQELGFVPVIYSPEFNLVNAGMVAACKEKGMKLIPWTVNDKASIDKLKALGVDGIITDYPDLMLSK
jgi:glycerophosphoryl diester phosphodiesterase